MTTTAKDAFEELTEEMTPQGFTASRLRSDWRHGHLFASRQTCREAVLQSPRSVSSQPKRMVSDRRSPR
jgi:hypothetical protein